MSNKKKRNSPTPQPKKKCQECGKDKSFTFFFKVDSQMFPDGMINICRDCVRANIDIDNVEEVIGFLRQIDKPFYQSEWDKAYERRDKAHPMGSYMQKLGLQQYKGKTFNNSDGIDGVGLVDLSSINPPEQIESVDGKVIEYSEDFVTKWGTGYSKVEYLKMEKFYQDMKATHDIVTPVHINKLMALSKLTVKADKLIQNEDWANHSKVSKTIEDMEKNAGFRPVDRQGIDDATGIKSFSQIFEEVEKKGWRKPPAPVFDEDIVDAMIIALANYYHRLVGKQILQDIPDEVREEIDEFFKDDLTPVEIDDEAYEDLDFTIGEDDEDYVPEEEEVKEESLNKEEVVKEEEEKDNG
jgi:hypothetical protein